MQRVMLDHAFRWAREVEAFVPVDLPCHVPVPGWESPLRYEAATVLRERIGSDYLGRLSNLMRIDPDVPVLLVPRLQQWDADEQRWEFGRRQTVGLCTRAQSRSFRDGREFGTVLKIVVSLGGSDPYLVLAHEFMHAAMTTLPQQEEELMRQWGDLLTELHESGESFDWRDRFERYEFLLDYEESEAEAFALWATHRRLPYGLHRLAVRSDIAARHDIDIRHLDQTIHDVVTVYSAVLAGERSARRNVLGAEGSRALPKGRLVTGIQKFLGLLQTSEGATS